MSEKTTGAMDELREIAEALVLSCLRAQEKADDAVQAADVLRSLVDGLDAIIWEADVGTWRYSFVSKRAEQFLGYPLAHWSAERDFWAAVIHPLDRLEVMEEWRLGILRGEHFAVDYRAVAADGHVVWLRNMVSVKDCPDGRPQRLRGVILDITQRHDVEAEMAALYLREHRIAETLQRSMLISPSQNCFPELAIETFYEPCWDEAQVGGDFYDVFAPSPGKVALIVGDVSGKGLIAAARTVQVKYALRAFLHDESPMDAMCHLNSYLTESMGTEGTGEEFVVLCACVLDLESGDAVLVAAGSEQPMALRNGRDVLFVDVGGLPLGVTQGATYTPASLHLGQGDTLLMTTDGLTEARQGRHFLGAEGVAQMAQNALLLGLKPMGEAVLEGARAFAQGKFRDDVCMLLARRR